MAWRILLKAFSIFQPPAGHGLGKAPPALAFAAPKGSVIALCLAATASVAWRAQHVFSAQDDHAAMALAGLVADAGARRRAVIGVGASLLGQFARVLGRRGIGGRAGAGGQQADRGTGHGESVGISWHVQDTQSRKC